MNFDLPVSKEESDAVHLAIDELRIHLVRSSDLAEKIVQLLNMNFVEIDEDYRKKLQMATLSVDLALWNMNVALHKMRNHQSSIISPRDQ